MFVKFKASDVPYQKDGQTFGPYLFRKDTAFTVFTNSISESIDGEPDCFKLPAIGFDPTDVLDETYRIFYKFDCDAEIVVEITNQVLTILRKPQNSFSRFFLSGKNYRVGKDCIYRGDNTFSFRHVSTSGGYGSGLLMDETISTMSLNDESFEYDVSRTDFGLFLWVIPVIIHREGSHLAIEKTDDCKDR